MFGGVHFSFYKPLLKRAQKLISVSKSVRMPFGALVYFRFKKRGNGPYRVDSSSFKSKVGDCQGTKIMEKTIAI